MKPFIAIEGLEFTYGGGSAPGSPGFRLCVDELAIAAGEEVACIGASGSGKTTLIHLIAGIEVPARGRVVLDGVPVSELPDDERRALRLSAVGMIFQRFELLAYLDALDNILLPYHVSPHLAPDAAVRERARELARATGIEDLLTRRPRRLSQGERQRVAVCRALVTEPKLVICDEPTGNLDPDTASAALDLLFEQTRARGATLLVVTHDHGILDRFQRVIDMRTLNARAAQEAST